MKRKRKKQITNQKQYINQCPSIYDGCKEHRGLLCYAHTKESCYVMSEVRRLM